MTYNELKAALAAAGIGDASECRREAELLIEAFGGIKASELPFRRSENISSPALDDAVRRRIAREPLQYILGEWEFFGLDLYVTPDCLIPRPDTEITVEAAIKLLPHGVRFADLGTGSGAIAVSVLKNRPDLHCTAVDISPAALSVAQKNAARKYESRLVVERLIKGRELTVGVIDGKALPPVEIIPKTGFYDYKNKYQSGLTTEICPAPLTEDETKKVQELAVATFHALRMEQYGRVDFIYGEDGIFYCLEANALPGMTPTSLLPQEAAAVGIGYDELCCMLAEMAKNK